MRPVLLACCLALCGAIAVAAAVRPDLPQPEPIPLRAAAVATPVRFPQSPPIPRTPPFVSTERQPGFSPDWHRQTLMRGYIPERPEDPMYAGY